MAKTKQVKKERRYFWVERSKRGAVVLMMQRHWNMRLVRNMVEARGGTIKRELWERVQLKEPKR